MPIQLRFLLLIALRFIGIAFCEDAQADDQYNAGTSDGSDYIKYWTEYAILPKRCIV